MCVYVRVCVHVCVCVMCVCGSVREVCMFVLCCVVCTSLSFSLALVAYEHTHLSLSLSLSLCLSLSHRSPDSVINSRNPNLLLEISIKHGCRNWRIHRHWDREVSNIWVNEVCGCVCVWARESERGIGKLFVCVCERERLTETEEFHRHWDTKKLNSICLFHVCIIITYN